MIKNIFTFIFIITFSIQAFSQKCENTIDPFTNEQVISFDFNQKSVYFEIKEEKIVFEVIFSYWGERDYEFMEGTELLFKLENGTKLELKTIRKSSPKIENVTSSSASVLFPRFGAGGTSSTTENFTSYSFTFTLTPEEIIKLAESQIEIIRIPETDNEGYVDLEAKGKTKRKVKAINKGAICLSENL